MAFQGFKNKPSLVCPKCKSTDYREVRTKDSIGRFRVKAECAKCSAYIKFLFIDGIGDDEKIAEYEMPFGKHKGEKLIDIPQDYLEWASNNFEKGTALKKINLFLWGEER